MAFLNRVTLIGRLTDNPEPARVLPNSGSTVVKFRFAVGRSKKNPQTGQWENDPNPLYIDCEAFSKPEYPGLTNVISQYCQKGKEIYIEGRLQYDTWEDKNNPGQKRSKHKVVVEAIQLLGGAGGGEGGESGGSFSGGGGGGGGNRFQQRPQQAPPGNSSPPPRMDDAPDHDENNGDIPF